MIEHDIVGIKRNRDPDDKEQQFAKRSKKLVNQPPVVEDEGGFVDHSEDEELSEEEEEEITEEEKHTVGLHNLDEVSEPSADLPGHDAFVNSNDSSGIDEKSFQGDVYQSIFTSNPKLQEFFVICPQRSFFCC